MRILFDITHPAHVHFFRHAIAELLARGDQVAVTTRHKDITVELLAELGIPATPLTAAGKGLAGLVVEMILRDVRLRRFCRRFRPDVLTAVSGAFAAQTAWLVGKPAVVWDDTEHQKFAHFVTRPFASAIFSPDCYTKPQGPKHHLYAGCHELAYLHPGRFTPDPQVVRSLGIDPHSRYCLVRFVSWGAHHDVGQHGIAADRRREFLESLSAVARPYVTSEAPLPAELEPFGLRVPVSKVHHVLAFAALYVGEGATMASEAALLGTPAVYTNTLPAGTIAMFARSGLVEQITDTDAALRRCLAWLADDQAKPRAAAARDRLLADKIDVTALIVQTLGDYARRGR
jgi:hypothetical protein